MSGGHFDYNQFHIQDIANSIDEYVNGHELDEDEVKEILSNSWYDERDKQYAREHNRTVPNHFDFSDETIAEFKRGLRVIREAYIYAQRIDWILSFDDGEESFHRRLRADLDKLNAENRAD